MFAPPVNRPLDIQELLNVIACRGSFRSPFRDTHRSVQIQQVCIAAMAISAAVMLSTSTRCVPE